MWKMSGAAGLEGLTGQRVLLSQVSYITHFHSKAYTNLEARRGEALHGQAAAAQEYFTAVTLSKFSFQSDFNSISWFLIFFYDTLVPENALNKLGLVKKPSEASLDKLTNSFKFKYTLKTNVFF